MRPTPQGVEPKQDTGMPNTYTQLYIQFVFAVNYCESLIKKVWKGELYKYITGIVLTKMPAINGMPDRIHIFIGYKPTIAIPEPK